MSMVAKRCETTMWHGGLKTQHKTTLQKQLTWRQGKLKSPWNTRRKWQLSDNRSFHNDQAGRESEMADSLQAGWLQIDHRWVTGNWGKAIKVSRSSCVWVRELQRNTQIKKLKTQTNVPVRIITVVLVLMLFKISTWKTKWNITVIAHSTTVFPHHHDKKEVSGMNVETTHVNPAQFLNSAAHASKTKRMAS